jgi:hypothetical protein
MLSPIARRECVLANSTAKAWEVSRMMSLFARPRTMLSPCWLTDQDSARDRESMPPDFHSDDGDLINAAGFVAGASMVNNARLIKPSEDFKSAFPGLNFRNRRSIRTSGESILLVDPTYIADVYNSTDEIATYLKANGLFLMDFGGDCSASVWWKPPSLKIAVAMCLTEKQRQTPRGARVLADDIGCDSGSFMFLPMVSTLLKGVRSKVDEVLRAKNGVVMKLPPGKWIAFYEQFAAPQRNIRGLYRNIVLRHTRP